MFTTRAEMKIFATNVVVDSGANGVGVAAAAAATATAALQQQQMQQQRDFRCGAQVKYNKNNNNYNSNKTANMLRQAKYNNTNNSNSNNNNNNSSDNKNAKRQHQQQQQQQSQQQHMRYNNNNNSNNNHVHNFTRKKYYGNNTNNNSNNNSYNCSQQQQQQSAYYQQQHQQQQQQHQQAATVATAKATNNNSSNNNNILIKNQNIVDEINCKLGNDSNNNNNSNNNNDNNNNNNTNSSNCPPKSQSKTISNNNNNNKKRNSVSSTTESSSSSSYYHSCSESSTTIQTAPTRSISNSNHIENEQQQQHKPSTPPAMETAVASKQVPSNTLGQSDNGNSSNSKGQRSRQQPLCFWKTSYPQQPTMQQKEQQLEAALATQKEKGLAMAAASTAATSSANQQPHYYQYQYYSQPKQLTIASFLQKELLPDGGKVNQQQQQKHHQQSQQHQQQQQQSSGYQQRYRNVNYNYNGYQQHSHTHQQHQQQQQQHHQNHNNNHRQNTHFRHNKKMHFNGNGNGNNSSTTTPQKSIERLPASNNNASHRRMTNNAAAAVGNGCSIAGNNEFYQVQQQHQHPHPYHFLPGKEHQNYYNLTYVNVDVPPPAMTIATSAAEAAAATTAIVAGIKAMPSLILKPLATANGAAVSPTSAPTTTTTAQSDVTKATAISAPTVAGATATATTGPNMFLQPAPSLQLLGPGMTSPIALTPDAVAATTPTNMISCAQLDEAITAAAANHNNHNNNTSNNHSCGKNVELTPVMTIPSPSYATIPFIMQQQQQQQQQLLFQNNKAQQQQPPPQQQQVFFGFSDGFNSAPAAWSHANSPCYSTVYGPSSGSMSSGSTHSRIQVHRPGAVSPALSTCSLASESQWSSRSRLTPTEVLSVSPTPTVNGTGQQLSPHPLTGSPAVGANMNGLHAMLPFSVPPPPTHNMHYPHYCGPNCGCNGSGSGSSATWPPAAWYELVLPPDRYLDHARNVELSMQPEQLLCHCKYDNLSLDIWKRFRGAQQTHARFKLKMRLWRYLFIWINPMFSRYRICLVGSTITGFGTDSSDIDMCLLPEQPSHHQQQHHYHNELRTEALMTLNLFHTVLKEMEAFQDFNLIEARVPILRFKDRINGIEVDLNYNNCVGIKNTYLLQLYAQMDWRARPLVVIVKLWAQYHDINDAKRMTVSSYSLVLMVLHYLQYGCVPHVLPCLQALYPEKFNLGQQDCLDLDLIEPIEPYQTHNTQTLGEHLLGFFKYYSNFDFRNNAISIRTGGVLPVTACRVAKSPKNDIHQWKELNIEEPFDLSNTARSVYDSATFERVKATFVNSARRLEHTLDLASIFTPIHHTQRMPPMHQPAMHLHSHPSHTHHSHPNPHQNPHPHPNQHQHSMHARNAAPTVPSKTITAGSFAAAATNLV